MKFKKWVWLCVLIFTLVILLYFLFNSNNEKRKIKENAQARSPLTGVMPKDSFGYSTFYDENENRLLIRFQGYFNNEKPLNSSNEFVDPLNVSVGDPNILNGTVDISSIKENYDKASLRISNILKSYYETSNELNSRDTKTSNLIKLISNTILMPQKTPISSSDANGVFNRYTFIPKNVDPRDYYYDNSPNSPVTSLYAIFKSNSNVDFMGSDTTDGAYKTMTPFQKIAYRCSQIYFILNWYDIFRNNDITTREINEKGIITIFNSRYGTLTNSGNTVSNSKNGNSGNSGNNGLSGISLDDPLKGIFAGLLKGRRAGFETREGFDWFGAIGREIGGGSSTSTGLLNTFYNSQQTLADTIARITDNIRGLKNNYNQANGAFNNCTNNRALDKTHGCPQNGLNCSSCGVNDSISYWNSWLDNQENNNNFNTFYAQNSGSVSSAASAVKFALLNLTTQKNNDITTCVNSWNTDKPRFLTSDFSKLATDIKVDIDKQYKLINDKIMPALDKLVKAFDSTEKARVLYNKITNSLYDSNDNCKLDFAEVYSRLVPNQDKNNLNQITNYSGSITDNDWEKVSLNLPILNEFNGVLEKLTIDGKNGGVMTQVDDLKKRSAAINDYLSNEYVKSKPIMLDKNEYLIYICDDDQQNAVNYVNDMYIKDILILTSGFFDYIYNHEDVKECINFIKNNPTPTDEQLDVEIGNVNKALDQTEKKDYSIKRLNNMINYRNVLFMLFVRSFGFIIPIIRNYPSISKLPNKRTNKMMGDVKELFNNYVFTSSSSNTANTTLTEYFNSFILLSNYVSKMSEYSSTIINKTLTNQFFEFSLKNQELSQGTAVYLSAQQFQNIIKSCQKYVNEIGTIFKDINTKFNTKNSDGILTEDQASSIGIQQTNVNSIFTTKGSYIDVLNSIAAEGAEEMADIEILRNFPTFFQYGTFGGCYKNSISNGEIDEKYINFEIGKVSSNNEKGSEKYGAIVNCVNDTIAYNNINETKYDVVTLKPYVGTANTPASSYDAAYTCYAGKRDDLIKFLDSAEGDPFKKPENFPADVSLCQIDNRQNVSEHSVIYNINDVKFNPTEDSLVFKGCYANSDLKNNIYNTMPHQICEGSGAGCSIIPDLNDPKNPKRFIEKCQKMVQESNNKNATEYDIYGITTNPDDTSQMFCYAGTTSFDAHYATADNLRISDYEKGCNLVYPGPNQYLVFQDASNSIGCSSNENNVLNTYNDAKINWLNNNVSQQNAAINRIGKSITNDIDIRFPIQYSVNDVFLAKSNSSSLSNIMNKNSKSDSPKMCKLDIVLTQGKDGGVGNNGEIGPVGPNGTPPDEGLPGYDGYWGEKGKN